MYITVSWTREFIEIDKCFNIIGFLRNPTYPFKNLTPRTKIYRLQPVPHTQKSLAKIIRKRHSPFKNKLWRENRMARGSDATLFKRIQLSSGAKCPLHNKAQALGSGYWTLYTVFFSIFPSQWRGEAPFPLTTTTSRSSRPSPASARESGKMVGWPPGEKVPAKG